MRKEFDRFLIITEPYGARTEYPLACRGDAARDLATAFYFDSDLAYGAFCDHVDECAAEDGYTVDPFSDYDSGAFDEWTGYKAYDTIDDAIRAGRAEAYGYTVELTDDERPYEVDESGIVYTDLDDDSDDDSDDSDGGDPVPAAPAAVLDPAPAVTYYHEPAAGMYHAVRHFGPALWGVALNLDQATGDGRTYAFRPTKAQCLAVLRSLAPAAVELPGLPAWLR